MQPFVNLRSIAQVQDWIRAETPRRPAGAGSGRRGRFRRGCASIDCRHAGNWMLPPPIIPSSSTPPMRSRSIPRRSRIAGITRDTPNPTGGAVVKDASGEPTGLCETPAACWRGSPYTDGEAAGHARAGPSAVSRCRDHQRDRARRHAAGIRHLRALKDARRLHVRSTVTIRVPGAGDAAAVERFVEGLPFKLRRWRRMAQGRAAQTRRGRRDPDRDVVHAKAVRARRAGALCLGQPGGSRVLDDHARADRMPRRHHSSRVAGRSSSTSPVTPAWTPCSTRLRPRSGSSPDRTGGIRSFTPTSCTPSSRRARPGSACSSTRSRRGTTRMPMRWRRGSAQIGWRISSVCKRGARPESRSRSIPTTCSGWIGTRQ